MGNRQRGVRRDHMGTILRDVIQRVAALAAVFACFAWPAHAQSEAEFVKAFAGSWTVFDDSFASGALKCSIDLETTGSGGRFDLVAKNCGAGLAGVAKWGIVDNQLAMLDASGAVQVRLGGNQHRMTGTTAAGKPVIFDRADAAGLRSPVLAAVKVAGCYYLGFSSTCAPLSELASPMAAGNKSAGKAKVVVNLNVRAEASDDAKVVGVIPQNTCISLETCLTASDGVWCQAKFGDKDGWFHKVALRQSRWPIVTFTNGCQ
jgi:hypothetical protein